MNIIRNAIEIISSSNYVLAYFSLFLISFLDTLIIIGAFFPASFFIMAAGFFCAHSGLSFGLSILVVTLGGLLGDLLSYFIGTKGTNWFKNENKFLRATYLEKGKTFFEKYREKSIVLGRFLGIIKSVIPFVAGLMKMDFKKFFYLNLFAGFVWTVFHLGVGYILGRTLTLFYVPKNIKLLVLILPFILFFAWLAFEYQRKIVDKLKTKN